MLYGVDYYPEHDDEARWAGDARLMAEAGFTAVRLAEFAWTRLEPQPGLFSFAWLDRAIETLAAHGLKIVLGTPTSAPPHWLSATHPEILYVDLHGRRAAPQSRRFVCLNNPVFQSASQRIVTALAQHYATHPALIGWQIDNEFGCHDTTRCHCSVCQQLFREWLQARYGSLDALNHAWGAVFWSQEYSDWSQIGLPAPTPAPPNPGHMLDAYRFASNCTRDYQQLQINILRDYAPGRPVCHNFMANFDQLDYAGLAQPLDIVAWDCYMPDGVTWADTARYHDVMRGFKHQPFWVLESPPGHVNWTTYNPDLQPGEARLRSLQAIAHGADAVFYFQWRAFRGGAEQYHSGILPHDGVPGRHYQEAAALGAELAQLRPLLAGTTVRAQVAIVGDMAGYWALQLQPHSQALSRPEDYVRPWYDALRRRNIAVEFCQPTDDLRGYRLVIAPSLHVLSSAAADNLTSYVRDGGALVLGPRSGFKEPTNRVTELPLPGLLGVVVGARVLEWAALPPDEWRMVQGEGVLEGQEGAAVLWRELLEPRGAAPLLRYASGAETGQIAATTHQFGDGEAWYVGCLGAHLIDALVAARLGTLGLSGLETPVGVEACERIGDARRFLFLLNHTAQPQDVALPTAYRDALSDQPPATRVGLRPFDVRVFEIG